MVSVGKNGYIRRGEFDMFKEDMDTTKEKVTIIMENHLPHMQQSLTRIEDGLINHDLQYKDVKKWLWIITVLTLGHLVGYDNLQMLAVMGGF